MFNDNQRHCRVSLSLLGLIVLSMKLISLERCQFIDKIGGEKIRNPYVMIVWTV
jgi:hypothetical protein